MTRVAQSRGVVMLARIGVFMIVHAAFVPGVAWAQVQAPPSPGSRIWVVAGTGFSVARLGCADCDTDGIFHQSRSLLVDAGVRVNPKVDVGMELYFVSSKVEAEDPMRTTFILVLAQLRPWHQRGFFMRVGMGLGFAGNGIYNPIKNTLEPPYTTNALGMVYGAGWIFSPYRRFAIQVQATHHVAAMGELATTSGTTVSNVVGNYWTVGTGIVIR